MLPLPSIKAFTSEGFIFTPISEQHQALIISLYTNKKAMHFIEPVQSAQSALKIHQSFVKKNNNTHSGFYTWAVQANQSYKTCTEVKTKNNDDIGFVVLYTKIGKNTLPLPEIGIMLKPHISGNGIATQVLSALIMQVFQLIPCDAINIRFHQKHTAMQRISEKLGFIYDELQQNQERKFIYDEMRIETIEKSKIVY
ncbi:GNAT family N-acetyltransferase [Colwellia sp. RSH04]|uniref:GNAT family N-acetyltransferase n=1 Tax=Colwellia sp. RSH04 TaxID=2305464 RepID=UPI000E587BCE|nr:GNAT family N-acetyltransferase [Colwellia sp. RSH04]RHW76086.1 N-acetyltransferase [Colwellia sp. RSH04]